MTALPLSPAYREAVKVSLILQAAVFALVATIEDWDLPRVVACSMIGFWLGVAVIMTRRPRTPGRLDLFFIRWGFVPMLALGLTLMPWMGWLR